MAEPNKWNVIFLVDSDQVNELVLLKRSDDKKFAPGMRTGIGGKQDQGETPQEGAYRELREETNIINVELHEFARVIIDGTGCIYYFWGLLDKRELPTTADGVLEWIAKDKLSDLNIIPTTKWLCEEWAGRKFDLHSPFTVYVHETGRDVTVKLVEVQKVEQGLADFT